MVFSNITTRITVARTVDLLLLANHKFWMSSHDLQRFNRNFLSDSIAIFDDEIARFDCDLSPFLMVRSQFFMIPSAFFIMFHNSIPIFPWSTPNQNHISRAFFFLASTAPATRRGHPPDAPPAPGARRRPRRAHGQPGPRAAAEGPPGDPKPRPVAEVSLLVRFRRRFCFVGVFFLFGEQKW